MYLLIDFIVKKIDIYHFCDNKINIKTVKLNCKKKVLKCNNCIGCINFIAAF